MKIYLGDSVYADWDGWNIVLTTENDDSEPPSNVIMMEPEVIESFKRLLKKLEEGEQTHDIPE